MKLVVGVLIGQRRSVVFGLAVVLFATALCLATALSDGTSPLLAPDSGGYLQVASRIDAGGIPFDPTRTPGYPLLLAALLATPWGLNSTVCLQALLIIGSALLWFYLVRQITRATAVAIAVGVLVGCDLEAAGYTRYVLTECLAFFAVGVTMLSYWRWLEDPSRLRGTILTLVFFGLVLVRPALLIVPVGLLTIEAIRSVWNPARSAAIRRTLAVAMGTSGIVAAYIVGNGVSTGYFGLSDTGSIVEFGKVLEYQMESMSTGRNYGYLPQAAQQFTAQGDDNPGTFGERYPEFTMDHWALLGSFSNDVIVHHPTVFFTGALKDVVLVIVSPPRFQRSFAGQGTLAQKGLLAWRLALTQQAYPSPLSQVLQLLTALEGIGYVVLVGSTGAAIWLLTRAPRDPVMLVSVATLVVALAGVLSVAAGGPPGAFERLRTPFDAPMMAGTVMAGRQALILLAARRVRIPA